MKSRSGQILILVLLIVVVTLAVGLSVASRNITNLKTSTQTEHSQRAFSAAEGGVEDILSRPLTPGNFPVPVGNITANVTVAASATYERTIELGDVGQIDLAGPPAATGSQIQIEWAKVGDPSESPPDTKPASVEVILVKDVAGSISQTRYYFQGDPSRTPSLETGSFSPVTFCSPTGYSLCTTIPLESGAKLLRIKPFWVKATVKVSSVGGTLPNQLYEITSTATTELGLTRKVQVSRTALPQLPAVFDYALFSENEIIK